MMMSRRILWAVPSHLRHDTAVTHRWLTDAVYFVADDQVHAYQKLGVQIVTHPKELHGLTPKINWILRYAEEHNYDAVIKADDDLVKPVWLGGRVSELSW